MQTTIKTDVTINGIGLHSGKDITLTLKPAPADHGLVFIRTDLDNDQNIIPALWNKVIDTRLCTVVANDSDASVGTIEHLMSALCAMGIDNLIMEISGAEAPIMDGSAQPFISAIEQVGIQSLGVPKRVIRILKDVHIEKDGKKVTLSPAGTPTYTGRIEFDHPDIGTQDYSIKLVNGNFRHEIAEARTFGFLHEAEYLRANGLALGGSLDNAIILDTDKILNEEGLRYENEFIRHKLLDSIGDLYLAGAPIQGEYHGYKAGHEMNNAILHALFADQSAWEYA